MAAVYTRRLGESTGPPAGTLQTIHTATGPEVVREVVLFNPGSSIELVNLQLVSPGGTFHLIRSEVPPGDSRYEFRTALEADDELAFYAAVDGTTIVVTGYIFGVEPL